MVFNLFKPKLSSIGCFGKLPIYADFINLRSENKELSLFDKWIQEGIHFAKIKLENNFQGHYRDYLFYNFIYQPKDSDKSIAGILSPGMDKSGRFFPFVIFIATEKYQIDSDLGVFLSYLQDVFFSNAANIAKFGWIGLELDAFLKKYFSREVLLKYNQKYRDDYIKFLKSETIGSYFKGLAGDLNEEKRYLIVQNLLDIVNPLSKENSSRFSLGIKFPLSAHRQKNKFEIAFWINMLTKFIPLKKVCPSLFWSNSENNAKPNLFCYLNEPSSKHFLSLLNISSDLDDSVCGLSEMRVSVLDDVKKSMPEKHAALLNDSEVTLERFLNAIT